MSDFLAGVLFAMSLVASLYFWRSWRDTADRLFVYFGWAFALLAVHWATLVLIPPHLEAQHRLYLVRLAAFVLLLIGIVQKNRTDQHR
jgi:Ca2+/Na+ antiporter